MYISVRKGGRAFELAFVLCTYTVLFMNKLDHDFHHYRLTLGLESVYWRSCISIIATQDNTTQTGQRLRHENFISFLGASSLFASSTITGIHSLRPKLWRESAGVSGEQAGEPDVRQTQPEHDDTLQTDSTTGVRRAAVAESVDVVAQALVLGVDGRDALAHALLQEGRVVDALRAGHDLLAAHEEVVAVGGAGVGVLGVVGGLSFGAGHGVEGADGQRVLVEDVEVGAVLLEHEGAEALLVGGAEVVEVADLDAIVAEHLDTLAEGQARNLAGLGELELFDRVNTTDQVGLAAVAGAQAVEDVQHELLEETDNLMVVLLEGHLHIETGELGKVAGCVGVLGAEDGTNLHDTLETGGDEHLLVELGRLCEEGLGVEVLDLEDTGTTLGGRAEETRRVDTDELPGAEELLEEVDDTVLDGEDGGVVLAAEVDHAVVESGVEGDNGPAVLLGLVVLAFFRDGPLCVGDLHGQLRIGLGNDVQLLDVQLEVLDRCALDQLLRLLDKTVYEDNTLVGDLASKLDHLPAERLALGDNGLDGVETLPEGDEGELGALGSGVLDDTAEDDLRSTGLVHVGGVLVFLSDLGQVHALDLLGGGHVWLGAEHGHLAIVLFGDVVCVGGLLLSLLLGLALCGFLGLYNIPVSGVLSQHCI